jgi:hypothetical protein
MSSSYYVHEVVTNIGVMISIYDEDVVLNKRFKDIRFSEKCDIEKVKSKIRGAVSVTFYGESAVEMGIELGYIHPEAVTSLRGVKVAMFIKTY